MDLIPLLLMFGLLGVMMYFMTRRQRRAQEQQQALQNSLDVGDRVMTTSGLYGTVTDSSDSATITIEIADGVETEWLRAAVREKVGPVDEAVDEDTDVVEVEDVVEEPVVADAKDTEDAELESGKKK
ncbi:preprotein translocase subunit YajC [Actinophytocola sp.]|uniref:preprotein translocase subunit YajC n=1 Tax=Actinophytocola sp. TaxID=1872138 RepID=UPI002ED08C00